MVYTRTESIRIATRRWPAATSRSTAARAPPRLSSRTVSARSPPAGRSRKTTPRPISTSGRRYAWSNPAGTTMRPSTRRAHRSRRSCSSRSGSSSELAGDVVAPETELGDRGEHPLDQLRLHVRRIVDHAGYGLEAHPRDPRHVDHGGPPAVPSPPRPGDPPRRRRRLAVHRPASLGHAGSLGGQLSCPPES